jgi:hypothetical protein
MGLDEPGVVQEQLSVLRTSGAGRRSVRIEQMGIEQVPVPKDQIICPEALAPRLPGFRRPPSAQIESICRLGSRLAF